MKRIILFLLSLSLLAAVSCGPDKPPVLTAQELTVEKEKVKNVCQRYNQASADKNWAEIVELLSRDVVFYGTDSAEVLKNFEEFQKKINEQWKHYDVMTYGEMTDVHIETDPYAQLASIIFGVPCDIRKGDKSIHYFLRVARTLKKEEGKWVISSGIVGIVKTDNTWKDFNGIAGENEKKDNAEQTGE